MPVHEWHTRITGSLSRTPAIVYLSRYKVLSLFSQRNRSTLYGVSKLYIRFRKSKTLTNQLYILVNSLKENNIYQLDMDIKHFNSSDLEGQSSKDGSVNVTFHGNIAILHMMCGENRLNIDFITKMNKALDTVLRNEDIQVLITSSDGKMYSNGLDLDWMAKLMGDDNKNRTFMVDFVKALFERLTTFPIPTIAALNGHAFAGGCMLALCHDYIVMSSTRGWMCLNEVHLGMLFAPFMKNIIQAKLPAGKTMHEAMVLGKRFTAEEALDRGIIQKICPRDELLDTAKQFGASLVNRGPYNRESLQNMKKDMYCHCFDVPLIESKL